MVICDKWYPIWQCPYSFIFFALIGADERHSTQTMNTHTTFVTKQKWSRSQKYKPYGFLQFASFKLEQCPNGPSLMMMSVMIHWFMNMEMTLQLSIHEDLWQIRDSGKNLVKKCSLVGIQCDILASHSWTALVTTKANPIRWDIPPYIWLTRKSPGSTKTQQTENSRSKSVMNAKHIEGGSCDL